MNPAELNLNPLSQIDPVLIVAIMLLMLGTYFALRRVFVLPYLRVMNEREELFSVADAKHLEAEDVVRQADYECERALSEAAQAAEQIRADASDRAAAYRRQCVGEATEAASHQLEEGRATIAEERAAHVATLREQAIDCVSLACSKLLNGSSESDVVEATVDRLLSRRAQ